MKILERSFGGGWSGAKRSNEWMWTNNEHNKQAAVCRLHNFVILYVLNMAYEFAPSLSELFMRFYEVMLEGIVAKLSLPMTALFRCIIECSKFHNVYDYGSKKVHNKQSNKVKTFFMRIAENLLNFLTSTSLRKVSLKSFTVSFTAWQTRRQQQKFVHCKLLNLW